MLGVHWSSIMPIVTTIIKVICLIKESTWVRIFLLSAVPSVIDLFPQMPSQMRRAKKRSEFSKTLLLRYHGQRHLVGWH